MTDVRTSFTHPLRVDWLPATRRGRVGMTFAPGKKSRARDGFWWERDLDADLAALRAARADVLVSLLEDHELLTYGIPSLFSRAAASGLEVVRFPIRDVDVPTDRAAVDQLLATIENRVAQGRGVVIHCAGGLGRTGTIAGCYLVRGGMPADEALRVLARVRQSQECPQTEAQRAFVRNHPPRRAPHGQPDLLGGLGLRGPAAPVSGAPRKADVIRRIQEAEREIRQTAGRAWTFDTTGHATLTVGGRVYAAGRFTTPSIQALRDQIATHPPTHPGKLHLSVLCGTHPATDVGALQASAAPETMFQAASQFNGLEAPGPHIVPVSHYPYDPTQGPRAAVSAFPAALLRHHQAPPLAGGPRFEQTDAHHLNLLAGVFPPAVAEVRSGYLQLHHVHQPAAFLAALEHRLDQIRIGVHDDVEVVFGADWGGPVPPGQRISQVFTSTIALGGYATSADAAFARAACAPLLRAAYLGTLLAAIALDKRRVVLTLIGGGVFGNPLDAIWGALFAALTEVEPLVRRDLDVIVNARDGLTPSARAEVSRRRGQVVGPDHPEIAGA
jgi:protein-tyrosine phosphatase